MKLYIKYLSVAAISAFLISCSSSPKTEYEEMPEKELYSLAEQELSTGNIRISIAMLEALDKTYPFGAYSQQVQLDLIYAYYKSGDFPLAIASIDRFLKLNPTHPNVDWVLYMRGISNMRQSDDTIQGWFEIDRSDRDSAFDIAAFKDFSYLISSFPDSPYSYDAEKRLIYIKNRLAEKEYKIAEFYYKREAYVAVINRVTEMLKEYPDTNMTKRALYLMRDAYNQLGLTDEANKTEQLIQANQNNINFKDTDKPFLWIF